MARHPLTKDVDCSLGSIVEIVMFMVLLKRRELVLLKGAILGSILANVLLCLGACFVASGFRRLDATFHEAITEAGSGLLLTALVTPVNLYGRVD